jgi:hypothetical protein
MARNASIASIHHSFDNTPGQHSNTHQRQTSINYNVIHGFFGAQAVIYLQHFLWTLSSLILSMVVIYHL